MPDIAYLRLPAVLDRRPWLPVSLFFSLLLLLGLWVYSDYGLSIDENQSRDNGMISLKHVLQRFDPDLALWDPAFGPYTVPLSEHYDRDYGVMFEAPVCYVERLLRLETTRERFLFRHLATFLVCWGGCLAFFQLARRRFSSWKWGLLGTLWLVLSPRLFADFFYNDKDAVFMALFAVATNTGVRLLRRPSLRTAGWHALACAVTIDVRIMGVLLPAATLALLLVRVLYGEVRASKALVVSLVYGGLTTGLVVALWPYLWSAPLHNFLLAWRNMSVFRWGGEVLYFGKMRAATSLPWHYAFVWMGITTPLLYVVPFLLGLVVVIRQIILRLRAGGLRLWATEQEMQDVLFLGLWLVPLLAILILKSVVYDGWRQLYFLYPAALLLALRGAWSLWHWRPAAGWAQYWPRLLAGVTLVSMGSIAVQMVRAHPLQNVYFNLLAGKDVPHRFEMDYWGVSYRQGLEYVLAHDERPRITFNAPMPSPAAFNVLILPPRCKTGLYLWMISTKPIITSRLTGSMPKTTSSRTRKCIR
ncbi:hypothetical protein [Hymenobacter sp. 5414T-23]|uniref:hypothetical protein n=1 Tax=Hymenobacter sp. 5414T-23 TaxID=2932252 RepID=UPI001FD3882B|nr:hypothetical protein [Hymenobacter sp. 5414T-23]UOQ80805.1 hypothetical protein MUN83_18630 [Hymenobacter sp. 5414T-23]